MTPSATRLVVDITSIDPLSIGFDRSVSNRVETYRHIPGTVLRGALAALWIAKHDPSKDRVGFERLFEGSTIFGPAMPTSAGIEPLSVFRCKYRPLESCWEFSLDYAVDPADGLPVCEACGGPTAAGKGRVLGVSTVERTRTALEGGTAKEGVLFTRSAIPAGTDFAGEIIADDAGAVDWVEHLAGSTFWVGGGRSTGGRASIDSVKRMPIDEPANLDAGQPAVLRLESPAILVDAATRPMPGFTEDLLSEMLGVSVIIEQQWVRMERVGGWNAVAGTPKPQEVAFSSGSTVRFKPDEPVDGERLGSLVMEGIGLRRIEGFGRIAINPSRWTPPPIVTTEFDTYDDTVLDLFRRLESLGLAGKVEIADAITEASMSVGTRELSDLIGRDYFRRLDDKQEELLRTVVEAEVAVLNDLAVCLDANQADVRDESGGRQ